MLEIQLRYNRSSHDAFVTERQMVRTAIPAVEWPAHSGIEGVGARAAAPDADVSGERTALAVRSWSPGRPPDTFPYRAVLDHVGTVGRMHVRDRVLAPLRDVAVREVAAPDGRWPLPQWLPSTVDQDNSTYDGYLLTELLLSVVDLDDERSVDRLLGGLAADTLAAEAEMLRRHPGRAQRTRTAAAATVLGKLSTVDGRRAVPDDELALHLAVMARDFRRALPEDTRLAIDIALLPITRLHDEHMFFRNVQLFEMLYAYLGARLQRAGHALRRGDVPAAVEQLDRAVRRLGLSQPLYRVLTTMPKTSFAIIRVHSDGRSAVQSRHYRRVELLCAPRRPVPQTADLPPVTLGGPVLQDVFLSIVDKLEPVAVSLLTERMSALDQGWRAMKRTHWGVTLKIIGDDEGTGGTSGARYLERAAGVRLFPLLAEAGETRP